VLSSAEELVAGYYDFFPPKSSQVSVTSKKDAVSTRQVLVATQDFKAGDVIYKA